jgi:eukaryotic-like serine/threonine-protein kinase
MTAPGISQVVIGDHNVFTASGDVHQYNITYSLSPADAEDRRVLLTLLEKVRRFWVQGVLEQSMHREARLELGLVQSTDAVDHPWQRVLEIPGQHAKALNDDAKISDVYDDAARSLLILGDPGSGKTFTLLELAAQLIERAERDPTQPIPVVLSLSAWDDKHAGFGAWVDAELKTKYSIPSTLSRRWLSQQRLLLLLDGLDETTPELREACVKEINAFGENDGVPGIIVCCRLAEYMALTTRLRLGGAVVIQPLDDAAIDRYIANAGGSLEALGVCIRQDEALRELARTPLMLSVMSLAYRDQSVGTILVTGEHADVETSRRRVLDAYVDRMFERKGQRGGIPRERVEKWLGSLARGMQAHSQTVFLIEQLQASWLPAGARRFAYLFVSRLVTMTPVWLGALIFSNNRPFVVPAAFVFVFALAVVDAIRLERTTGPAPDRELINWRATRSALMYGIPSAITGCVVGNRDGDTQLAFYAVQLGLLYALVYGHRARHYRRWGDIDTVEKLNWSLKHASRGAMWGALGGLVGGLVLGMGDPVQTFLGGLAGPLAFGVFGAIFGGMRGGRVPRTTRPNQGIRLSLRNAALAAVTVFFALAAIGAIITSTVGMAIGPMALLLDWAIVASTVVVTVIAGIWYGGADAIQHFTLRTMLWLGGAMPRRLAAFLDHAASLVFMRKVGGGYVFIHRVVLEYFAAK